MTVRHRPIGDVPNPIGRQLALACFRAGGEPQPRTSVEARSKPGAPQQTLSTGHSPHSLLSFSETVERVDRGTHASLE